MSIMRDGTPIVQPDNFSFQTSFDAITMVILGGSGSVTGSALGGVLITFTVKAIELLQGTDAVQDLRRAYEWLDLNALRMIVYAMVLIALMILRPEGILGERELFGKKRPKPRRCPPSRSPEGGGGCRRRRRGRRGVSDLHVEKLTKRFGGLRAVGDVSFRVLHRCIFGLIG